MELEERSPMINARSKHCMTAFNGDSLIVTGGVKKKHATKSCEIYNIRENTWQEVAPMSEGRTSHAALEIKEGLLYVFCGYGKGKKYLDSIERFTKSTNKWDIIITNVKIPGRQYPTVVSIDSG